MLTYAKELFSLVFFLNKRNLNITNHLLERYGVMLCNLLILLSEGKGRNS